MNINIEKIREAINSSIIHWQRTLNICQNTISLPYVLKDKIMYIKLQAEGMGEVEIKFSSEECKLCQVSEEIYNNSYKNFRLLLSNVWCVLCPLYLLVNEFDTKSICSHKNNEEFMKFYTYSIKHNTIDGFHMAYASRMLDTLQFVLKNFDSCIKSNDDYIKLIKKGVKVSGCIKKG